MRTTSFQQRTSGVRVPPPLYFIGGFLIALLLQRVLRRPARRKAAPRTLGLGLIAAGVALNAWALATMRRASTSPSPWSPTSALVTGGPFRFTRNPIYAGDAFIYLGAASMSQSTWPMALLPAVLAALQKTVIEKEERYLDKCFGSEYRAYRRNVRRWL